MKLSTKGRYAVMALVDMLSEGGASSAKEAISLSDIAARQGISLVYLEQLFAKLRKGRLVESIRGPGGGYWFARPVDQISIADVLQAVEEPVTTVRCSSKSDKGCMGHSGQCQTHALWADLGHHITHFLKSTSLTDALKGSKNTMALAPGVYMDYNATAPMRPQVREALLAAYEQGGNPSSVHFFGRRIRSLIEQSRKVIAEAIDALPSQVTFTSGGTEANALALWGTIKGHHIKTVMISAVEHDSIRLFAQSLSQDLGVNLRVIPVDSHGKIHLQALEQMLEEEQGKVLVSVMMANNETGVLQPIQEVVAIVHGKQGLVHCDAVQAFGKIPLSFQRLGVDLMSLSGHKIGGPTGVGALITCPGISLTSLWVGGGQEKGRRSGTENAAAIHGFAAAVKASLLEDQEQIGRWRDQLERSLRHQVPHVQIFGQNVERLPNTSCFTMPGVKNEIQVMALDGAGFAVSSGAACSSGKVRSSSHVLEAMKVEKAQAETAIRLSLGWQNRAEDIENFLQAWYTIYQRHQSLYQQAQAS